MTISYILGKKVNTRCRTDKAKIERLNGIKAKFVFMYQRLYIKANRPNWILTKC